MFDEHTRAEFEEQSEQAIETLLNTKTRQAIIDAINEYVDPIDWIDWSDYTTRQILEEVRRSDLAAGEYDTGILAGIYAELV